MRIHVERSKNCQPGDVAEVESRVCKYFNGERRLSRADQKEVIIEMRTLTDNGVEPVGAAPTGSVYIYFLCETFDALIFFKNKLDSGELTRILESVFNRISAKISIHMVLDVSLDEASYYSSIKEARETSKNCNHNIYFCDFLRKACYYIVIIIYVNIK